MQWMDGVLKKAEETQFFFDEYRCPIYVKDLVAILQALIAKWFSGLIYFKISAWKMYSLINRLWCWVLFILCDYA